MSYILTIFLLTMISSCQQAQNATQTDVQLEENTNEDLKFFMPKPEKIDCNKFADKDFKKEEGVCYIGAILAFEGSQAKDSIGRQHGMELALDEVNDRITTGEWPGSAIKKFELRVEDSKGKPEIAREAYKKHHCNDIQQIVGPPNSSQTNIVADIATANYTMVNAMSSTAEGINSPFKSMLRMTQHDGNQAFTIYDRIHEKGNFGLFIFARKDIWADGLIKRLLSNVTPPHVNVYQYEREQKEFNDHVEQLALAIVTNNATPSSTAILLLSFEETIPIFEAMSAFESDNPLLKDFDFGEFNFYIADGFTQNEALMDSKIASDFAAKVGLEGSVAGVPKWPNYELHIKKHERKYNETPRYYWITSYDATYMFMQVALENNECEPEIDPQAGKAARQEMIKWEQDLRDAGKSLTNAGSGLIEFDANGDRKRGLYDWYRVEKIDDEYSWVKLPLSPL